MTQEKSKGISKLKELFWYSDSEPNEVLIAFCHLFCLPLAIYHDFEVKNYFLMILGVLSGSYQLWAVLWRNCIKCRLVAVEFASLIAIGTVINLYRNELLYGSNTGWIIILLFAFWNTIRVYIEKIRRYG